MLAKMNDYNIRSILPDPDGKSRDEGESKPCVCVQHEHDLLGAAPREAADKQSMGQLNDVLTDHGTPMGEFKI